jgi:hypothetical protein
MSTASTQLARVKMRLDDLNLASSTFAKACGISPALLSTALRGGVNISGPVEARLAEASMRLVEIAAIITPLALPDHADGLRLLLENFQPEHSAALRAAISLTFNSSGSDAIEHPGS